MNILPIFSPGNLLIWLPGLAFFLMALHSFRSLQAGKSVKQPLMTTLTLFVIALVIAVFIPVTQINQAITFANTLEGDTVNRYEDISYEAKDAWFMTALPEDQRPAIQTANDDMFSFDQTAAEMAGADKTAASVSESMKGGTDAPEYAPVKSVAWFMLFCFMVLGSLCILQDIKRFKTAV